MLSQHVISTVVGVVVNTKLANLLVSQTIFSMEMNFIREEHFTILVILRFVEKIKAKAIKKRVRSMGLSSIIALSNVS